MRTEYLVQCHSSQTVRELLLDKCTSVRSDKIGVASAFCTVSGVREFQHISGTANSFELIAGLDEFITSPDAIKLMGLFRNSNVRIAGVRYTGTKFHPKVFFLSSTDSESPNVLIIGSANLTLEGLTRNIEVLTIVESENQQEKSELMAVWRDLWNIGKDVNDQVIADYTAEFAKNKPVYKKAPRVNQEILKSDTALVDPTLANTCWIEVGKITGFQSEQLEIKSEQALFFGLPPSGGADTEISASLRGGQTVNIPTMFYGNAMWRLNLPQSIPEVKRGLRPAKKRSPFVAVFTKRNSHIHLKFIKKSSGKFKKLKRQSGENGTLGKTTARLYGWF